MKTKFNYKDTNFLISIPEYIKKIINERWFYLYNWINLWEMKASIERDFFEKYKLLSTLIFFIITVPSLVLLRLNLEYLAYKYFIFSIIWIIISLFLFLLYFIFIRANLLRKNQMIIITDRYILLNWKIIEINKLNKSIKINTEINKIWCIFNEMIFKESNLNTIKNVYFYNITDNIKNGIKSLFEIKTPLHIIWSLIISIITILYHLILFTLTFSIIIILIFVLYILNIIIKQVLIILNNKIIKINKRFEDIDKNSNKLYIEKENILGFLVEAKNNDWKDSLILKINSSIEKINKYALKSIETSIVLKKEIETSKYKEMFNFVIYNSWIKKQIYEPLKQIHDLLEKNLNLLNEKKLEVEKQVKNTKKESLKENLLLTKKRIEIKTEDFKKHISSIKIYLEKLQWYSK